MVSNRKERGITAKFCFLPPASSASVDIQTLLALTASWDRDPSTESTRTSTKGSVLVPSKAPGSWGSWTAGPGNCSRPASEAPSTLPGPDPSEPDPSQASGRARRRSGGSRGSRGVCWGVCCRGCWGDLGLPDPSDWLGFPDPSRGLDFPDPCRELGLLEPSTGLGFPDLGEGMLWSCCTPSVTVESCPAAAEAGEMREIFPLGFWMWGKTLAPKRPDGVRSWKRPLAMSAWNCFLRAR